MTLFLDTYKRQMVGILLFLCLSVSAEGACLQPDNKQIRILTNEALLMNDFPEGSDVTYRCARGYTRENGTGAAFCIGGEWTEPDLHCRKKDCGPLAPRSNMHFEYGPEGTLFAASVKAVCDKGYRIQGPSFIKCYDSGWIGKSRCEVISCPKPVEIANGINSWISEENPKYGDVIHYNCDDGFSLSGNTSIECNRTGKYNSQPPECKRGTNNVTEVNEISTEVPASITHPDTVTTTSKPSTVAPIIQRGTNNTMEVNDISTEITTSIIHTNTVTTTSDTSMIPPLTQRGTNNTTAVNDISTEVTTSIIHTNIVTTTREASEIPPLTQHDTDNTADFTTSTTHPVTTTTRESATAPPLIQRNGKVVAGIIAGVTAATLVVGTWLYILNRKKKGSYDTGEDLSQLQILENEKTPQAIHAGQCLSLTEHL